MKKTISLLLIFIFIIAFASCGIMPSGMSEITKAPTSAELLERPQTESPLAETAKTEDTEAQTAPDETLKTETQAVITEAEAPPIISGVKSIIYVYEDDSKYSVNSALLEGVSAEGHEVKLKISSAESGEIVSSLTPGIYDLIYYCDRADIMPASSRLCVREADKEPPVISGAADKVVVIGDSVSYRKGVEVSDNDDTSVRLEVDASHVDLTKLGTYSVTYSATDKRGNTAKMTVKVTVIEKPYEGYVGNNDVCTLEEFNKLCNSIIEEITTPSMTDREKASAIYDRVNSIKYVSTTVGDDNSMTAAYIGLTTGRGDCQNYAAASKALLCAAGIPNYDMERMGGKSRHFWNLVYVEGGWYHFDACPTLPKYPMKIFLLTDDEAAAYSKSCLGISNYLVYDREACPYEVVKSRE